MLIPSIDLLDGKAVQLRQGKAENKVVEIDDPARLLQKFSLYGEVAIIDLNAALGRGDNKSLIKQLLRLTPCRVGGGIRDLQTAQEYLKAGASKIIIGTRCQESWVDKLPKQSLIFAIDAKEDYWVTHGWQEATPAKVLDIIPELAPRCAEFLYTQVKKEGMMQGLDRQRIREVVEASAVPVTIAGGITDLEDIRFIQSLGCNAQIGMALYTGAFSLAEAFQASVDFTKQNLIPTIVQDVDTNQVLMLAYSNADSLAQALEEKAGIYFSRSRQQLWRKGETSGNRQQLVRVDIDCDGDTLLFWVKQSGAACHFDRYSCFPRAEPAFDLNLLDQVLAKRQTSAQQDSNSYTAKLFADPDLQVEKLREECEELIEAKDFDEVRWEASDLIFFALVRARANGVTFTDIENELRSRFDDR